MRGRPRKPTDLKIAEGNPGGRPLDETEPKPSGRVGECPKHLKDVARRHWFRMAKMLEQLATDWDADALARYCASYGRWVEAEEHIGKHGVVVKSPNGHPIQNPYLAIANKAMEQMESGASKFGLTPSDRARIHVPVKEDDDQSEDDRMFGT